MVFFLDHLNNDIKILDTEVLHVDYKCIIEMFPGLL